MAVDIADAYSGKHLPQEGCAEEQCTEVLAVHRGWVTAPDDNLFVGDGGLACMRRSSSKPLVE